MSNDENMHIDRDHELITSEMIDEPLIIVLDEDDDDDDDDLEDMNTVTDQEKQAIISNEISSKSEKFFFEKYPTEPSNNSVQTPIESILITKSEVSPSESSSQSTKPTRTILINRNVPPQRRRKSLSKPKSTSISHPLFVDSFLSFITFDKVPDILTVSRMGSIYYCVEDLYIKIFSPLCTLEEFTSLLIKPRVIIVKEVTLSEKLSIAQENPRLRRFTHTRYRLIPMDSSDYLLKMKQLLLANKRINKIIAEMRIYKQTSSLSHEKTSTKRVAIQDTERNKRLKSMTNKPQPTDQSPLTSNENVTLTSNSTKCSSSSIETIPNDNLSSRKISSRRSHRSKSSMLKKEQIRTRLTRSASVPSVKFDIKDEIILKIESKITESMDSKMPMIVNVEENVQINDSTIASDSLPYPMKTSSPEYPPSISEPSIPYPYLYQPPSYYLTPIRTPYNIYYPDSCPLPPPYPKSRELSSKHHSTNTPPMNSTPIIMSLLEKPIHQHLLTSEKPPPTTSCPSYSSATNPSPLYQKILQKKKTNHHRHASKSASLIQQQQQQQQQQQHRISLTPYPSTKTYFAPLSTHHPSMIEPAHHLDIHFSRSPITSDLPNSNCIHLSHAIIAHNHCDIDKLPKLVIRHRKIYLNKTIDTMGQLFPSWFNAPDYRCIHCFNCDRVFTPQLFMTHVDDQQMINEQPLSMTSIQLLTSEKMSEYKVHLWNNFCSNLTIYASEGRIAGF